MTLASPKITKREVDCLKSIRNLSANGWPARLKDISVDMKVRSPTVLGFLERLSDQSLVEKGPAGYRPSKYGAEVLDRTLRAHRLFETLLARTGVALEEACRISSEVDAQIGGVAVSTLCAHLRHPRQCPHGMEIPAGDKHDRTFSER